LLEQNGSLHGFAAMAGRRNKFRLCANISRGSSVTNNIRLQVLSSTTKQKQAAVRGWTCNEYRHSSKPWSLAGIINSPQQIQE